jgi:hypothetical protein
MWSNCSSRRLVVDNHEYRFDEKQFAAWVKQASKVPGKKM